MHVLFLWCCYVLLPRLYPVDSLLDQHAGSDLLKLHAWYGQDRIVPVPATKILDQSLMSDSQFHFYKRYMYAKDQQHKTEHQEHMTLAQVIRTLDMDRAFRTQLAPFITLANLALTMPLSTAECERGFSTLARIKTNQRNWLLNTTLSHLMMISIQGPTIADVTSEWCDAVTRMWFKQKDRRLEL